LPATIHSCNLGFSAGEELAQDEGSQNLLIDADDTLWENNIYFERVIAEVMALLERAGADIRFFRSELDETERRRIPISGYGTVHFTDSLVETCSRFLPPGSDPALCNEIRCRSLAIQNHPLEMLDGVPETLSYLAEHHSLFLVTKGDLEEQQRKIRASGLQHHFRSIEILPEKDCQAFSRLLAEHGWNPNKSWMIGNSPRSDINPALAAGLKAVYIPHAHTWTLEREHPAIHPDLLELENFSELKLHF
jgi:putative hydrolase of the HAD superfamily